jgi:hypothetical protein
MSKKKGKNVAKLQSQDRAGCALEVIHIAGFSVDLRKPKG